MRVRTSDVTEAEFPEAKVVYSDYSLKKYVDYNGKELDLKTCLALDTETGEAILYKRDMYGSIVLEDGKIVKEFKRFIAPLKESWK